ncbi:MAG: 1-acyl-sn-glycerol-3-phosphate acyltransferase [Betaproteobacteria bacterium]|nr:1-acyl-sn-glycerol-3-phosphate acyltransferase [Betaproteobacteria bacterium]MCL2886454.1 1-acyl-sn-glycerol-3-phosphate acyltransferase [Betaproteobacteria bacterium]
MIALRSTLFMVYVTVWSVLTIPLVIFAALLLRGRWGYRAGKLWRLGVQFGVENILGIRPRVLGLENMPQEACVILAKHQSAWETMVLQDCVPKGAYCVFVLKKELLAVPFLGWGLGAMKMISIDRAASRKALDRVVIQGRERLQQGYYVIIFPEGTRVPPGGKLRYKAGGAYLATRVGCKVVPVAHNAGELWPRQAFLKKPGTITISIGPAFEAGGLSENEVNRRAEEWIEAEMRRLAPHRYPDVSPDAPPDAA